MDILGHLPCEVLLLILSHVDEKDHRACQYLNKAFYTVTIPSLWKRIESTSANSLTNVLQTIDMSPFCPGQYVRDVTMTTNMTNADFSLLISHVPLVEHLRLWQTTGITDESFQHLPRQCRHLTTLALYGAHLTEASMIILGKYCRQLSSIDFTDSIADLDTDFLAGLQHCPLKDITIQLFTTTTETNPMMIEQTPLNLSRFQHLMALTIVAPGFVEDVTSVILFGNVWPHLKHLHMDPCPSLYDGLAIPFLQAHPHIEYLNWSDSRITDRTLDAMILHSPALKYLDILYCPLVSTNAMSRLIDANDVIICYDGPPRDDNAFWDDGFIEDEDDFYWDDNYHGDFHALVML